MVITHKSMKEKLSVSVPVRPDDPRYKFMSKEQALAADKVISDDRDAVEKFKRDRVAAREAGKKEPKAPKSEIPEFEGKELAKKVSDLEYKMTKIRGPGAKEKKAAIREQILALNEKKDK